MLIRQEYLQMSMSVMSVHCFSPVVVTFVASLLKACVMLFKSQFLLQNCFTLHRYSAMCRFEA